MEPTIGALTEPGPGCAYSAEPGAPVCTAPAAVHVIATAVVTGEITGISICLHHLAVARAAAGLRYLEHPHSATCSHLDAQVVVAPSGASRCDIVVNATARPSPVLARIDGVIDNLLGRRGTQ